MCLKCTRLCFTQSRGVFFLDPELSLDGMDVWETLSKGKPSPRKNVILHYDNHPVSPGYAVR